MSNWKTMHKPKMIHPDILERIRAPQRPHYKVYLETKINSLGWQNRKNLTNYLVNNYKDNPEKYQYISNRYYHGVKYLANYIFANYSYDKEYNLNVKKECKFGRDQLYFDLNKIEFISI